MHSPLWVHDIKLHDCNLLWFRRHLFHTIINVRYVNIILIMLVFFKINMSQSQNERQKQLLVNYIRYYPSLCR